MVDYGLQDKVALITGANNPQGIGATTALEFDVMSEALFLWSKKVDCFLRQTDGSLFKGADLLYYSSPNATSGSAAWPFL